MASTRITLTLEQIEALDISIRYFMADSDNNFGIGWSGIDKMLSEHEILLHNQRAELKDVQEKLVLARLRTSSI